MKGEGVRNGLVGLCRRWDADFLFLSTLVRCLPFFSHSLSLLFSLYLYLSLSLPIPLSLPLSISLPISYSFSLHKYSSYTHTHSHPFILSPSCNPSWYFRSSFLQHFLFLSLPSYSLGFTPFDPAVRSNYPSLDGTTDSLEGCKFSKVKISKASSERRMTKELISPRLVDEEMDSPRVQPISYTRKSSTESGAGRSRIHSLSSPAAAILLLSEQNCDNSVTAAQIESQGGGTIEAEGGPEPLLSHVTSRSSMRGDWNTRADSSIEWDDTDAEKARKSSTTDRSAKILATIAGLQVRLSFCPNVFCRVYFSIMSFPTSSSPYFTHSKSV